MILAVLLLLNLSFSHEPVPTLEQVKEHVLTYPTIVKLHPPTVHFAISLPFATLISGFYFMLRWRKLEPVVHLFSLLTLISLATAVATGYYVHQSITNIPLHAEAVELLHMHQRVGFVLLFIALINFTLTLLYSFKKNPFLAYLFIAINLLLCVGVVYQGSLGGSLVYDYSVGVPIK